MAESFTFPAEDAAKLERRLPPSLSSRRTAEGARESPDPERETTPRQRPFVTLTYASSLDSALTLTPGIYTALSGRQSLAMTHFLRSRHDAICVGVGAAVADDPSLNCRLDTARGRPERQPRPVVIDPRARWDLTENTKVLRLARAGLGRAPFIVTGVQNPPPAGKALLESLGGKYIVLEGPSRRDEQEGGGAADDAASPGWFRWQDILSALHAEGIGSVMVEGGGHLINNLLGPQSVGLIDSVIVTIAPTWLGQGGVVVSPSRVFDHDGKPKAAVRLGNTSWHPLGDDVVLCGEIQQTDAPLKAGRPSAD